MIRRVLTILPEAWFQQQSTLVLLVIGLAAIVAVVKGADWLVAAAAGMAQRLGLPQVIIGATIVSLGTTSPEAAVSVMAAWRGESGIALGNGVGSIIVDTGFILGLGILLTRVEARAVVLNRQGWIQLGAGVLLCVLCYGLFMWRGDAAALGRVVGVLLVGLLVAYLLVSVYWSRTLRRREQFHAIAAGEPDTPAQGGRHLAIMLAMGGLGLVVVIVAGDTLVTSASEVAMRWGVPSVVLAATLIAFGTSMPELVVGLTAIRRGHTGLLLGNIIGADILNVLFVVGASALAQPLPIVGHSDDAPWQYLLLQLHLPVMLLLLVLLRLFMAPAIKQGYFSRWMGLPLITIYVVYVAVQLTTIG